MFSLILACIGQMATRALETLGNVDDHQLKSPSMQLFIISILATTLRMGGLECLVQDSQDPKY